MVFPGLLYLCGGSVSFLEYFLAFSRRVEWCLCFTRLVACSFSWALSSVCGGSVSFLEAFLDFLFRLLERSLCFTRLVACGFPWACSLSCLELEWICHICIHMHWSGGTFGSICNIICVLFMDCSGIAWSKSEQYKYCSGIHHGGISHRCNKTMFMVRYCTVRDQFMDGDQTA